MTQITFLVNTSLASTLATGSIVTYNVAFTILQIPLGVIGIPLGVVLLPSMSRAMARRREPASTPGSSCVRCASCSTSCSS